MVDHRDIQGVLAANLRRLRIARHLSLSELARATKISQLDGISQRGIDELAVDGELRLAEISLDARQARELDAKPVGSRAHLFVLEGKFIAGPVERITELAGGDYASFPTDVPHVYEAGRDPARALLLSQSPR